MIIIIIIIIIITITTHNHSHNNNTDNHNHDNNTVIIIIIIIIIIIMIILIMTIQITIIIIIVIILILSIGGRRAPLAYLPLDQSDTVNLHTNIMDFRGFDSSIILILRGEIPGPIGDFPGTFSSQAILVGIMLVGVTWHKSLHVWHLISLHQWIFGVGSGVPCVVSTMFLRHGQMGA